jgi:hypothetical protein
MSAEPQEVPTQLENARKLFSLVTVVGTYEEPISDTLRK